LNIKSAADFGPPHHITASEDPVIRHPNFRGRKGRRLQAERSAGQQVTPQQHTGQAACTEHEGAPWQMTGWPRGGSHLNLICLTKHGHRWATINKLVATMQPIRGVQQVVDWEWCSKHHNPTIKQYSTRHGRIKVIQATVPIRDIVPGQKALPTCLITGTANF
jgi:hypothetical protein